MKKLNTIEKCTRFRAKLWKNAGPAGWYFVTIPKSVSNRIRKTYQTSEQGWGRLKATATIGKTTWQTAIWFDTKADSYLLPIKATIRKKENLEINVLINGKLEFDLDDWILRHL